MRSKLVMVLLLLAVAACAGPSAQPATRPKRPALENKQVRPIDWDARDATARLWPASTKRLQVLVTEGWSRAERLVWFVAEGKTVLHVWKSTPAQVVEISQRVVEDLNKPEMELPGTVFWHGGAGSVSKPAPKPDPPPAPILPSRYVDDVLDIAWTLDQKAIETIQQGGSVVW